MTDNAHAAQRIRAALAGRRTIATADLVALLDEHAALQAGQPKPFHLTADVVLDKTDLDKCSIGLGDPSTRLRGRRPLSARLDRIADALFVSASQIETTRRRTYKALTDQIMALRIEADTARATEPKKADR